MARIFYEKDASLEPLSGKTAAVVGYGIQGRGQALNLRDSGVKVLVAARPQSVGWERAERDGFAPVEASEASAQADVIVLLTQDHLQPKVHTEAIAPHLRQGKALFFSHGFNLHYRQIVPPDKVDVVLVAPKGPGGLLRELYTQGKGLPCLLAVHQDASGSAHRLGLAYAMAIGGTRAGVLETTVKEETETDLFGEQVVLCGGVSELIRAGFETLVAAGYQPEVAYFECCHELKLIMDLIYKHGIAGMYRRVSDTAEYGGMTRGPRIVDEQVCKEMQSLLKGVQSGEFAREWINENESGRLNYTALGKKEAEHLIEEVGARLRAMMPWLGE